MRFLTLLPTALLAATSYAREEDPSPSSAAAASSDPPTAGAIWTAKWDTDALQPYTQHCKNRNTYNAKIYKLSELYPDLKDFAPELKVFYNKQHYAGSWSGIDLHGTARDLMRMDLSSLPYKVRDWLKRNPSQKHFSVQEDSVFFAPGAIYPILPLWVDEPEEGELECETAFDELDRYSAELGDGRVVGRVVQRESGKNEVEFTVEAVLVKKKGRAPTRGREEL